MMKKINYLILLQVSLLTSILLFYSYAGCEEDKFVIDGFTFSAEPRPEMLGESHLTILNFTIGIHSLEDVQKELGYTQFLQRREHAPFQICYKSTLKSDETKVVFEAGPMGGWKKLTAFKIISNKANLLGSDKCEKSTFISKRIQTKSGIRLGITKGQLEKILGSPSKEINNNLFFVYRTKRNMSESEIKKMAELWPQVRDNPFFDVSSVVHAIFLNSELISVAISKIETY
jgi:hypothetical protein